MWIMALSASNGGIPRWLFFVMDNSIVDTTVPAKFSAFISSAESSIVQHIETALVLHIVFDKYYRLSTKSSCHTSRQKGLSRVFMLKGESPLPKQSTILNMSANKEKLIRVIVKKLCFIQVLQGKRITPCNTKFVHELELLFSDFFRA